VYRVIATLSALLMILVTHLPPLPVALAAAATGTLMLTNAGRMVAALAMVTGSVDQERRGGFMSANSAVQHISTGLGAILGGWIVGDNTLDQSIRHFDRVGWIAVAATLFSLWLAGLVRPAAKPAPQPADVGAFEDVLEDPLSAAESL
jgi:MFS family permease